MTRRSGLIRAAMCALCLWILACDDEAATGTSNGGSCTANSDCASNRCEAGTCVAADADVGVDTTPAQDSTSTDSTSSDTTGSGDTSGTTDSGGDTEPADTGAVDTAAPDTGPVDTGPVLCSDGRPECTPGACCEANQRCAYGGCILDLGFCQSNDDCTGDSYCDADERCTPYGVPETVTNDPACERPIEIGTFAPEEQCAWTGPADSSDPTFAFRNVYSAPMVADFNFDNDANVLSPSIVFSSFGSSSDGGILRIIDGRTCEEQYRLADAADRTVYASNNAIGDIDLAGDNRPEIVSTALRGYRDAGGIVAFKYNAVQDRFERMWYGRDCAQSGEPRHIVNDWANNNGLSLHDLNDDGVPEILFDMFVYDNQGCVLNPQRSYNNYLRLGVFPVVSDVDNDGLPELVTSEGVFAWDDSAKDWTLEPYWDPTTDQLADATRTGHVAVADFGGFPGSRGDVSGGAEIVVASAPTSSSGATSTGNVRVMTIAGEILFGPYDLPAEGSLVAGRGGPPTIADFDGDGRREFAVAGGSRYTVFDLDCDINGDTGFGCERVSGLPRGVLWSRQSKDESSNVTGSSVFDFDGDGLAEVVYGDECFVRIYRGTDGEVLFSRSASTGTGYEYPVIADVDGDFNSEIVVALTNYSSCPATDPLYTAGTSTFQASQGVIVLRDELDRWAASRPIWNQHAYSVVNVEDDGGIPQTSAVARNHSDSTLNNFRMNAQGSLEVRGAADFTVAVGRVVEVCGALPGNTVTLAANVCNRGTNPVPDGARVVFYAGDPDSGAPLACETSLPTLLQPSNCTEVTCSWTVPQGSTIDSLTVVVDPDGEVFECRSGNNQGTLPSGICN